jgi:Spy/CpxP family protein refolding chaperone
MRQPFFITSIALATLWTVPAAAQPMMHPRALLGRPAFLEHVFRPELIMQHQSDIEITDDQRDAITKAMGATQKTLVDLQWRYQAASQELAKIVSAERVDEQQALRQAESVMGIEQEIKKEHLALLIRIKNTLTPAQQEKLRALRPRRERGQGRRGKP